MTRSTKRKIESATETASLSLPIQPPQLSKIQREINLKIWQMKSCKMKNLRNLHLKILSIIKM